MYRRMSEAAAGGNIQYIVYNMDDKEVFLNAKLSGSIKDIMSKIMESDNQVTGTPINEFFKAGIIDDGKIKSFLTSIDTTQHNENEEANMVPNKEVTEGHNASDEVVPNELVQPGGGVKKTRKHHKKGTRSKKPKKRSHKKKH